MSKTSDDSLLAARTLSQVSQSDTVCNTIITIETFLEYSCYIHNLAQN